MREIDILNPRDRDILTRLKDHYNESLENFTKNQIKNSKKRFKTSVDNDIFRFIFVIF